MMDKEYQDTLERGVSVLCKAMGVDMEHYDSDSADTECYMDCFKDAAQALKKFGVVFDSDTGEFIQVADKY
jgi:3-methyladenine DNA glycosylase Mpg